MQAGLVFCKHTFRIECKQDRSHRLAHYEPGFAVGAGVLSLCSLRMDVATVPAEAQMMGAMCRLWCAGARLDWQKFFAGDAAQSL